jgi:tripartite-type tricarboxylate transporter receptor subunit TctC
LLNKSAKFDPKKDIVPVCQMFVEPAALLVAKDSRFKSLQDIIDEAKRRPGELTYASPGINSLYHLCGEAIQQLAGIKLKHVPYSGAAQYVIDMMGGRIDLASSTLGTYMQNRDKLRGIILAMPVRAKQAPEIPTAAEAGLKGLDIPAGSGIFTPAKTPPAVIEKIAAVYKKMIVDPAAAERIQRLGLETGFRSSEDFRADLAKQYSAISELIKTAGLKPAG